MSIPSGHTDLVRLILQDIKGIRIDQQNRLGQTALMKAAIQGRADCARLLLYAGVCVKYTTSTSEKTKRKMDDAKSPRKCNERHETAASAG